MNGAGHIICDLSLKKYVKGGKENIHKEKNYKKIGTKEK
jgi:hypothetical protein